MKTIKLSIFYCALFLMLSSNSFATYERTTVGGGPNGYAYTFKHVDEDGNTTIVCNDAGYETCPTAPPPPPNTDWEIGTRAFIGVDVSVQEGLARHALTQIYVGSLNGTKLAGNFRVEWHSVDNIGSTSSIRVNKIR